jgi:uncharacterized membrane protein
MSELLVTATEITVAAIDGMALLIIIIGTALAFVNGLRVMLTSASRHDKRAVWLHYARWLVVALTFQLAADIIETSIRTDWESIARLGAIALIRTFLNYFLERDLKDLQEQQSDAEPAGT